MQEIRRGPSREQRLDSAFEPKGECMKNAILIGFLILAAACASVSRLPRPVPELPGDAESYTDSAVPDAPTSSAHSHQVQESIDPFSSSGP